MFMKKQDSRQLSQEIQQHNRLLAIRLYERGQSRAEIAKILEVHYVVICQWIRVWKKAGESALKLGKRGRRPIEQRLLTPEQELKLKELLREKNPEQMSLPFALWNRKAIQEVVWKMWRIRIAIRTLGDYLKRWGYTPQKPAKRAYERNPKMVQKWLDITYPEIQRRAMHEKAEIYWGDETGIRNDCQHSRGYAPQGQTPIVTVQGKRFSINMISAINNRGTVRFMMYKENMTAKVLIRFMKRLIKDAKRKVFLILDNLKVHHSKLVKAWLSKYQKDIAVFYLPAYSPDMNPDEYLNSDLKAGIGASSSAKNQSDLEKKVRQHMRMLQTKPERVKKYFYHPSIRYAA